MELRQRGYWLRQSEAIRRQNIGTIIHGVGIAMTSDKEAHRRGMDDLELGQYTSEESRKQRSEHTWSLMKLFGGGKGV